MDASSIRKLLISTKLESIRSLQHIIVLRDTATVDQSLKVLATHKILSAPVVVDVDGVHGPAQWPYEKESTDILGFVDIRDILTSFLAELDLTGISSMKMLQRMRLLEDKGQQFAATQLRSLKYIGGDGDFVHVAQAKVTLLELITDGLLDPRTKGVYGGTNKSDVVHRMAVFDGEGRITNVVTQTDVVRYLLNNIDQLGGLADASVADLGWAGRHVECVGPSTPAIEGMALMASKNVSALAVTDAEGRIIGNFSVTEMRTIMAEHFGSLALPVGEFLALEHGTEYAGYARVSETDDEVQLSAAHRFVADRSARGRPRTPGEEVGQTLLLCRPSSTFAEVLEVLVGRGRYVHRVYVVDEGERPIGVITCTDVLRKIMALCHE